MNLVRQKVLTFVRAVPIRSACTTSSTVESIDARLAQLNQQVIGINTKLVEFEKRKIAENKNNFDFHAKLGMASVGFMCVSLSFLMII